MARQVRKSSGPRPGASLVDATFSRVGLADKAREYAALYAWHRLAGDRFGKRTRAERVLGGALLVRVASAPWANELGYLRSHLLEELRAVEGGEHIKELRFTIGPLDELPVWDEPVVSMAQRIEMPPAPTLDHGKIAEALLRITDPELREALGELFARAAHRR